MTLQLTLSPSRTSSALMRITHRGIALVGLMTILLPRSGDAQACLGLHESRRVPTAELVSNFHRDGLIGPSTFGVTLTAGPFFGAVETGADPASGQAAPFAGNGVAGTLGIGARLGPLSGCIGGTKAQEETVGFTPTSAQAVFGGIALRLPRLFGLPLSAFGSVANETRTESPVGVDPIERTERVYRAGVASAVRPWLNLRVYQDITVEDDRRLGFSVGLVVPLWKTDADRDGVSDAVDRCPDTPAGTSVTTDGCPRDSDGDGVIDSLDKCPNTPAGSPVNATGCPQDSDGDGVADIKDQCPNTPADTPVNQFGCPLDSDGDGVVDLQDKCPNTPAQTPVTADGCPRDTDGDGVIDTKDQCPNTPVGVPVNASGCPLDSDGDGVIDSYDRCPNTPAGTQVTASGCPLDSDGDGVLDAADKCPNTPAGAVVNGEGCPVDSDGDGVADAKDRCPNTAPGVPVNADGCPLDGDGDGVPDAGDACPNTAAGTAVDARGCPTLFGTESSFTLTGVTFETSSAVIRPSSFGKLDEVAQALKGNPEVRVEISGHTDNVGSEDGNQRLSLARAQAVRQYFIEKGVAADRLEARGFGESKPVTTNETPEGRAENRRVEMRRLP